MNIKHQRTESIDSVGQMPQRTTRTERRKRERMLARARRKAEIAERIRKNPALKRFHF